MSISDWSSDVCSSDLVRSHQAGCNFRVPARFKLACLQTNHIQCSYVLIAYGALEYLLRAERNDAAGSSSRQSQVRLPFLGGDRSEEHTSELQSLMRSSYAVFCLKKKKKTNIIKNDRHLRKRTKGRRKTA